MLSLDRRSFLKSAAMLGAGVSVLGRSSARAQPVGANDAIRVAIIGLGSKGASHLENLLKVPDVRIAALCEVDEALLAESLQVARTGGASPFATQDARHVMDRSDVDAVVIATSDHWHAILSVWACQAGKDVYVEKPISNTVWSGRKIVESAERYQRVVQSGTQARSDTGIQEAVHFIRDGGLGKIQWIHALWFKRRLSIGRPLPWYPEGVDYDLFCGPAPMKPLVRDELHYDWHWFWDTGNGEMTNLSNHCVDIARWFAGYTELPDRVRSVGGRFALDDSGETPNTQLTLFDHGGIPIINESRGLPAAPGAQHMDNLRGARSGVVVQCEGGYFAGHYGGAVYSHEGKRMRAFASEGGGRHLDNFFAAMRSRRTADLAAPIETGYASSASCLFGSVSYRSGVHAPVAEARRAFEEQPIAVSAFDAMIGHLEKHAVDFSREPLTVGPWVRIDKGNNTVAEVVGGDEAALERARFFVRGTQRPPFVIPEQV